jgi:hypothetical protein
MFFGPRPIPTITETDDLGKHTVANFNATTEPGIYTVNAVAGDNGRVGAENRWYGSGYPDAMGYPIEIEGSTAPGGSNAHISNAVLHVYRSDVYPDNMLKETDASNASRFTRITQVFYGDLNRINPSGIVPDGNAYEAAPLVSVRYGIVKGSTVTWSRWVRLTREKIVTWFSVSGENQIPYVKNVDGSYSVTKKQIAERMRFSNEFELYNETGSKILLTVELPDPTSELIDLTFDVHASITPTFTYTRNGVAEPYTYSAPENMVEGANKARFTFSSNRSYWYLVTAG